MKTMKFFMLASAFASMIGFSSCLNGEIIPIAMVGKIL